jgi:hypothetical protein
MLPSFPSDVGNSGGLDLLFDGAFPLRDARDLFALLQIHALRRQQNDSTLSPKFV